MEAKKLATVKRFIIVVIAAVMMTAFINVSAKAEQLVDIKEGTYYIKAANGNFSSSV